MLTVSPITRQSAGKTFSISLSILAAAALVQLGAIGWAYVTRIQRQPLLARGAAEAEPPPVFARLSTPSPAPVLSGDPFAEPRDLPAAVAATPPKPTPVQSAPRAAEGEPASRFEELIVQGKLLRERGDTSTALIRFREAAAINARSPVPLAELAATYEKMSLADKAGEQWRRIYELGEQAGLYYNLAEAKLKESQARAIQQVVRGPEAEVEGIAAGMTLGLLPITSTELVDDAAMTKIAINIPVKARPQAVIDVSDLIIHVHFYDLVNGQTIEQTTANVNSRWKTAPADWLEGDTEVLTVEYQLPKPDAKAPRRENRKYFGYLVRVYYKSQLQAASADPERLGKDHPAPTLLSKEPES